MKHLLFFLLILIIFKGTESNHLNSKLWLSSNDFQKVIYNYHHYYTYFDKLFLKIAYLLKDYQLFTDFSYKEINTKGKLEYKCKSGLFAKTFVSDLESTLYNLYDSITVEKCLEYLIKSSPNNIESLINFINFFLMTFHYF